MCKVLKLYTRSTQSDSSLRETDVGFRDTLAHLFQQAYGKLQEN